MEVEMSGESAAAALRRELAARRPWGTWEELVLGGAVLRHGTADWSSVAEELRFRFSYPFTSQECEAKYEDAKERFSGFGAWLDELRRQRVDELRRELEQSEDSIGSLQLKLETLKAEKEGDQSRDSGNTDSPFPAENAEGADLSSKEPSHDRSSAGSFVEETRCAWSPELQIAESVSAQDFNMEGSRDFTWHVFGMGGNAVAVPVNLRKKRGARKRRFRIDANEGSAGLSDSVYSHDGNADESKGFSIQNTGPSNRGSNPSSEDYSQHSVGNHEDLEGILREHMKHESASLFHHRLESQKKARYRKMIRRHVDFQIIKSRIDDGAISSAKEVLRDLLLLSNNALVFYPKQSREHKSAFTLRHLVSQWLRKDRQAIQTPDVAASGESKVVKPEAGEPSCADKATGSGLKPERASIAKRAGNSRKASDACAAPAALLKKRKPGRPAKNSIHLGPKQSSVKGRKVRK